MRRLTCASILLASVGVIWGADPAVGTWKLNVAKSKFDPGPPPKSAMMTYEETADGIRRTGESISAEGTKGSFEYTAKYDGKDYPVKGLPIADSISLKRVNDRTSEASLKKNGTVVATARRVIAPDGKTMTLTITGANAKGEKTKSVSVYEKQ